MDEPLEVYSQALQKAEVARTEAILQAQRIYRLAIEQAKEKYRMSGGDMEAIDAN